MMFLAPAKELENNKWMFRLSLVVLLFCFCLPASSLDLGFRFDGHCHKGNTAGSNPEFLGECGNLTGTRLINKQYQNLNLLGAILNTTYLYMVTISESDLSRTSFQRSTILQSQFDAIKAHGMDLKGANLKKVSFKKSDLKLFFANATRFSNVSFKGAILESADFWGSQLLNVDFSEANLRGANLSNTFVLFTKFEKAQFDKYTQLPFSEEEALKRGMVKID
jgi:uncharacterized protein YjbI with pentapeptide repeats